ncbi:MAG: heme lyase CcmF/NrfE family subunit [Alphaproteobacteria bacterium]|nr:heme lyase CcmF/NrfE family subunit [Alphaproteobacteria bacterium]MBL7096583.1 heme lyase CcmF/NrfE family subunit [Alphaproteobacteria bacterium]
MTGEIGQLALCLALALSLLTAGAGLSGARPAAGTARSVASAGALGMLVFIALAFGTLTYASVVSDFSIQNVQQNSNTLKPLIYKITGVWGNHEGSMLLWVLVLAIYTAAIVFARRTHERMTSAALGVQGLLAAAFLVFILLTSNPFVRLDPMPFEGAGLNPLLQDFGLAVHPPILYSGYVGLSASFAFAAAALITKERDWVRAARPFMLVAWIALTLGIALGSWWAYYELGWGGFWFWDPVENASLMPWLVGTALLHSALATERTGAFRSWTLLLAIAGFSLSLIGTFLVRSGVLSSVHSFASDPTRGLYILGLIFGAIGGALALFAWRAPSLEEGAAFSPVSRETALLLNNVFLAAATATVFVGTLYPLALDAMTGTKISVGPPYFALTFAPIAVALLVLVPFGPQLAWKRGDARAAIRLLIPALGLAAVAGVALLALTTPRSLAGAGAFALAAWLLAASAIDLWKRKVPSAGAIASALAHAGLAITLIGIAGTTLWRSEALEVLAPGESMYVGEYQLRLDGVAGASGPNYQAARANIAVLRNGTVIAMMHPEKRFFPAEGQETVETAIRTTIFSDLYLALGDHRDQTHWIVRAYVNPVAPLIWLGALVMAIGGFAALWSRLTRRATAPNAIAAPAE